jgi:hypothetical protein
MPTRSRRGALPLLFRQGACLGFHKIWIDGRVIGVLSVDRIELFPDAQESLATDVCGNRICIKLASGPASDFGESLRVLENRIWNGDCSFHEPSITMVILMLRAAQSFWSLRELLPVGSGSSSAQVGFASRRNARFGHCPGIWMMRLLDASCDANSTGGGR